jgi:hypothetical protein
LTNLNLVEAYAKYGARAANRARARSAVAADGSVVITCLSNVFSRPGMGVLRYECDLAEAETDAKGTALLREHMALAHTSDLPVRLVIVTPPRGTADRTIHVRQDLVGKVIELEGDKFTVDFTRPAPPVTEAKIRRKR